MRYIIVGYISLIVGLLIGSATFDLIVRYESDRLIKAYEQKLHEVCDRCLK